MQNITGIRNMVGIAAICAAGATCAQEQNFIGLGVGVVPEYEGAQEYKVTPLPIVNYHSGPFFISPRGGLPALGLRSPVLPDVEAGVFATASLGRDADDTDRTRGLSDIDAHAVLGGYVEWAPGRYTLGATYRQAARSGYGATLDLNASYAAWRTERQSLRLGVGTQWANGDAMQTQFGVSDQDAARSQAGLTPYSPSSGFKSARLYANWTYKLTREWSMLSTVGINTVLGDARDSPLTQRKTSAFGSLGVIYRF